VVSTRNRGWFQQGTGGGFNIVTKRRGGQVCPPRLFITMLDESLKCWNGDADTMLGGGIGEVFRLYDGLCDIGAKILKKMVK